METQREIQKNTTVYNFDTIDVDGKPEVAFVCLKRMVGERGFEPPTPWSRTRCSTRLSHSPTCAVQPWMIATRQDAVGSATGWQLNPNPFLPHDYIIRIHGLRRTT